MSQELTREQQLPDKPHMRFEIQHEVATWLTFDHGGGHVTLPVKTMVVLYQDYAALRAQLEAMAAEITRLRESYHQLIYAVGSKYPGESRYETALRYIRERELNHGGAAMQALVREKEGA